KWYEGMSVSGARQQVLLALAAEPGISQKEIVSRYLVPKQTVSKEIHLMQEEGLLELLADDEDKRGKKIVMTEKGQKYTEEILQPYFDMESRIEKRMNPKVYRQMIDCLTAYADALGQEVNHER
ncbi:MAG: MarR family winged helix-turn-helix transcriptional regulator, partial [Candidatus Cryptobacteroides sp.]